MGLEIDVRSPRFLGSPILFFEWNCALDPVFEVFFNDRLFFIVVLDPQAVHFSVVEFALELNGFSVGEELLKRSVIDDSSVGLLDLLTSHRTA